MNRPPRRQITPLTRDQQQLVAKWQGLLVSVGRRIWHTGIPEDAKSEGNIGLCIAAMKFDPARGVKFNTYATHWVMAFMLTYLLSQQGGQVSFGTTRQQRRAFFGLGRARRKLVRLGIEETSEALAAELGCTVEVLETAKGRRDVQLDHVINAGDRPLELVADVPSPEDEALSGDATATLHQAVRHAIDMMQDRRLALILRTRWLAETPATLQQIADKVGVTRERVRQLEEKALRALRMSLEIKENHMAYNATRQARLNAGLCVDCGKKPHMDDRQICKSCSIAHAKRSAAKHRRERGVAPPPTCVPLNRRQRAGAGRPATARPAPFVVKEPPRSTPPVFKREGGAAQPAPQPAKIEPRPTGTVLL